MQYNYLGKSGLKISKISLGTWLNFDDNRNEEINLRILKTAFDAGVNFFDTADSYGLGNAESVLGKGLKKFPRQDFVISTKIFFGGEHPNHSGLGRKHMIHSVDGCLKRLQTEVIDLLYLHRFDEFTPLEETLGTLNRMMQQGKILFWGVSRWNKSQIDRALNMCEKLNYPKPIAYQDVYNLFNRTQGGERYVQYLHEEGIGTVGYSPLARGVLTNKYKNGIPADSRAAKPEYKKFIYDLTGEKIEAVQRLEPLAEKHQCTIAQLVISYLCSCTISSLVCGVTSLKQLEEIIGAEKIILEANTIREIEELFKPFGHDVSM